jgi:polyisoprenoid-binding protein YceI
MLKSSLAALAGLALLGVAAQAGHAPGAPAEAPEVRAGAYKLDKSHAKILWSTSHFGFSTYHGEFTEFDAQLTLNPARPENSRLDVTVDTRSISTNDAALDKHLNAPDFFNTAAYPSATFRSTRVQRTGPATAAVTGDLTLLGTTRPITLAVTFNKAGENPVSKAYTAGFSAEGVIKRSEFGMSTYAPAIGDDVKLTISGEFNPAG